jgi:xanthine dehydrogenase accessory factor
MTVSRTVAEKQQHLAQLHQSFVRATVVRTRHPTSARTGDVAVLDADGAMTGFVGGTCVEASVREFSLRALATGEPLLLKVRPGEVGRTEEEGAVEVHNPCLSGGSIDVFLEPVIPSARLVVVGEAPVAQSLARLGAELGFEVQLVDGETWQPGGDEAAVIVAAHGRGEEPALERALRAGVPYIGLIASERRGSAVVASLNVDDELRHHVHTPAGLRLGGTTPAEIALGVMAELVQVRVTTGASRVTASGRAPAGGAGAADDARRHSIAAASAIDPVCGMTVMMVDATPHAEQDGETVWFCSDSCRVAYRRDPARYAPA